MRQPTEQQRQEAEIALRKALSLSPIMRLKQMGVITAFQMLAVVQGFDSFAYIPADIVDRYTVYPIE